jgi:hypothetical protein
MEATEVPDGLSANRKLWQKSRQVLINALTGEVEASTQATGDPTYQELRAASPLLASQSVITAMPSAAKIIAIGLLQMLR